MSRHAAQPRAALYGVDGRFMRYVKQDDAREMEASGVAYVPEDGRCDDTHNIRVLRVGQTPKKHIDPLSLNDPTFITRSEMERNAEYRRRLNNGTLSQPRGVRLAHQKVLHWPEVHDHNAVTIIAGGCVWQPAEKASKARAKQRAREHAVKRHAEQQQTAARIEALA